jgi:uncharacterized protein YhbP (UPF0306 family)
MEKIPQEICSFLRENRVAAVCFNDEVGNPYCINVFFVYDPAHRVLIFKSSYGSFHEDHVRAVNNVAGSVLQENLNFLKPSGIQFTGKTLCESEVAGLGMASAYYGKYPFGRVMPGYIWAIRPEFIKLTDKAAAFGKKISWSVHARQTAVSPSAGLHE